MKAKLNKPASHQKNKMHPKKVEKHAAQPKKPQAKGKAVKAKPQSSPKAGKDMGKNKSSVGGKGKVTASMKKAMRDYGFE